MSTLKVTVGERDRLDDRTRRRIEAAREGRDLDDAEPVLNVESDAGLGRLLSPKNPELLEVVAEHAPESIRETAELVDRDYEQVHRNRTELGDVGANEFDGEGPGQPRKPTLAYDGLEIDIPFPDSGDNASAAARSLGDAFGRRRYPGPRRVLRPRP